MVRSMIMWGSRTPCAGREVVVEVAQRAVGDVEVEVGVDVDALELVHDEQADPAAEPVVVLVVDLGAGDVERAGLAVAQRSRGEVLAARAGRDVVVGGRRVGALGPEKGACGTTPTSESTPVASSSARARARVPGQPHGRGGLEQHDGVGRGVGLPGRGDRVPHDGLGRRWCPGRARRGAGTGPARRPTRATSAISSSSVETTTSSAGRAARACSMVHTISGLPADSRGGSCGARPWTRRGRG